MDISILFITSGLFLGWSLGANDAANLFGTAVGSKVIKFKTAAIIMSIFIILGAVISGAGASHTLGKLGSITKLPGAFTVALAAGLTVSFMTKYGLPVSTSQSIVGAIIGWNLFSKNPTNIETLTKIVSTWIICPLLSAFFSILIYKLIKKRAKQIKLNLFMKHIYIRYGLILVGAFGAYSLGANNIANVMGVFTNSFNISPLSFGLFTINQTQVIFLIGAISIAIGIITYSKNVMKTVGSSIYKLSPFTALIVVLASSLVLFVFASKNLQNFLISLNLPSFPLVPVSSSQAVVGAIIGIGLAKGDRNINLKKIKQIVIGWILTPISSVIISYIFLFFMENVFLQKVF